jgi:hypothetical protein
VFYLPLVLCNRVGPNAVCDHCGKSRSLGYIRGEVESDKKAEYAQILYKINACTKSVSQLLQEANIELEQKQWENFVAFEYGIVEYFLNTEHAQSLQGDAKIEFLRYYGNTVYQDEAAEVLALFREMYEGNTRQDRRELGSEFADQFNKTGNGSRELIKTFLEKALDTNINLLLPKGVAVSHAPPSVPSS